MRLKDKILKMQDEIQENIENLNSGGCIHFAKYFSDHLTSLGISHKIFFGNYWRREVISLDPFTPVSHVMVYINNIGYVDGYKILKYAKLKYRSNKLVEMRLQDKEILSHRDWNNRYQKYQNKLLQQIIKKHIK